jgi:hypothetical protein
MSDAPIQRRQAERELQKKGYVRCTTYMGNLARMNDLPVQRGPGLDGPSGTRESDWVPAWFEWHMVRFTRSHLQHVTQRERIEQAKAMAADKEAQFVLLCEAQLAGGTLYDPAADISTDHAVNILREELGRGKEG